MRPASISVRQTIAVLPFLFHLLSRTTAYPLIEERGTVLCDDDDENIAPTDDAPTGVNSPGLGVEFETASIQIYSEDCSASDFAAAKGKVINGRQGTNWMLTADTTADGYLSAEYILNGKTIKLGAGTAKVAAEAVASDVADWNPFADDKEVTIAGNPCKWKIVSPEEQTGGSFTWAPQITAPMGLSSLNTLFGKYVAGTSDILLPKIQQKPMVHVTKDFFQSSPNGISADSVGEDVLGFFSLVLSYSKAPDTDPDSAVFEDVSPKELTTIMPRTDFTSINDTIKGSIDGDLYSLVKVLGCYKNNGDSVELDTQYCGGTESSPTPNDTMDKRRFAVAPTDGEYTELTVKDWINGIQNSAAPDGLTTLDEKIDKSIGGLGASFESIPNSSKKAPLFEFRRLRRTKTSAMADFVSEGETEVLKYLTAAA